MEEPKDYILDGPTEQEAENAIAAHNRLIREYVNKSETELNKIFDLGLFNEICKGYAVIAMRATGVDEKAIAETAASMDRQFDYYTAADARTAYRNL